MKKLLFVILFVSCFKSYSQITYFYFPRQENSAVTSAKIENQEFYLKKAYEAYNQGDKQKARYYLSNSGRDGWESASFFYLKGQLFYDDNDIRAAKVSWYKGFKYHGCWECKELADKIKDEKAPRHIRHKKIDQ